MYINYKKNKFIVINDNNNGMYAKGKVDLVNSPVGELISIDTIMNKFEQAAQLTACSFYNSFQIIHAGLLSIATGLNLFLIGNAGVGKSSVLENLATNFSEKIFESHLSDGSSINQLIGGFDIATFVENGMWKRKPMGIQTNEIVIMNEFPRASMSLYNSFLQILENHSISENGFEKKLDLISIWATGNSFISPQTALSDRFLRVIVDVPKFKLSDFQKIIESDKGLKSNKSLFSKNEIFLLQAYVELKAAEESPLDFLLADISIKLKEITRISNRNIKNIKKLIVADELLMKSEIDDKRLMDLILMVIVNPHNEKVIKRKLNEILNETSDIVYQINNLSKRIVLLGQFEDANQYRTEYLFITKQLSKLRLEIKKLPPSENTISMFTKINQLTELL